MKKLLVPIDFSENAFVAASYACQIASEKKIDITLLYIYTLHTNQYINSSEELIDPSISEAKQEMEKFMAKLQQQFPHLTIQAAYRDGVLTEEIEKQLQKESYLSIVMGTKGSSGLESIFLGSNTYDVILRASIPVLAIPINATQLKKDSIALLCNFKEGEIEVLRQAVQLYGSNFHLKLIHINTNRVDIKELDQKFKLWISNIIAETQIQDISYTVKSTAYFANAKESITKGIQTLLRDDEVDIILITKSRKSFFQKLISENVVKSMAFEITVPNLFARV